MPSECIPIVSQVLPSIFYTVYGRDIRRRPQFDTGISLPKADCYLRRHGKARVGLVTVCSQSWGLIGWSPFAGFGGKSAHVTDLSELIRLDADFGDLSSIYDITYILWFVQIIIVYDLGSSFKACCCSIVLTILLSDSAAHATSNLVPGERIWSTAHNGRKELSYQLNTDNVPEQHT